MKKLSKKIPPDEVLCFLKVLDKFETTEYLKALVYFSKISKENPDYDSFKKICPLGSENWYEIDRVLCSYETAGVLIKRNALNEDLFFDLIGGIEKSWEKSKAWINGIREEYNSPESYENFEWLVKRKTKWIKKNTK